MKTALYAGTINKLDYASTKIHNIIDDFLLNDVAHPIFAPDAKTALKMCKMLDTIDDIIECQFVSSEIEWQMVKKFVVLSDGFRAARQMQS